MAIKESLQDVRLIGLEDFVWLLKKQKKKLVRLALFGALLAFSFLIYRGAVYRIEASFKEQKEENALESRDLVKQLFSNSLGSPSAHVQTLMASRAILRPLVEELGLQVESCAHKRPFLAILKDLWLSELGYPLQDLDGFRFQNVFYEGEKTLKLTLQFQDETHFDLFQGRQKIGSGLVSKPLICSNGLSLCVKRTPKRIQLQKKYPLRISPWLRVVKKLSKTLVVVPRKGSSSFYDLIYLTRDKAQGVELIDALMRQFQTYLKKEHDELGREQIAFLAKRQQELCLELERDLQERASYMGQTLREKGFLNASQELGIFSEPYAKMASELFAIDVELKQLETGGVLTVDSPLARSLSSKEDQLKNLQKQKDLLEMTLSEGHFAPKSASLSSELEEIRQKKKELQEQLQKWQAGGEVLWDADLLVSAWAQKLQPEGAAAQRQNIQEYLTDRLRLLSMRENIVSKRYLQNGAIPSEFEGIDWETSRALYQDCAHRLDLAEGLIKSLQDVLAKMDAEDAELGCLSSVLKDPVSQQLIASAGALYLQMKEKKYCSAKEELRWQEDWQLQKNLLSEHVRQTLRVEQMSAELMREKLFALQQVGLDCISQQISILKQHMQEETQQRSRELILEKQRLQEKMKEMRLEFAALPETWRSEQLFELKSKAHQKMMETIAQLVETKTIGHHLHRVGSKPLDAAISSLLPEAPRALLLICLGAIVASGVYFFGLALQKALTGFPMTGRKLKALGLPFSGEISSSFPKASLEDLCPEDVEVFRNVFLFLDAPGGSKVIGLLGEGGDFSEVLAELSRRAGKKVWLLSASSEKKGESGVEWIRSSRFSSLIADLKNRYDLIFLSSRAPLGASEARAALAICDQIVVSLNGEQIDLLTPFIFWAYDKEYCRLTFIAPKSS